MSAPNVGIFQVPSPAQPVQLIRLGGVLVEVVNDSLGFADEVVETPVKTLLDWALDCVRRGWYVLPCYPRTKLPAGSVVENGVNNASNDEAVIRAWWAINPNFNPAIACGPSNLVVMDFDSSAPFSDLAPTFTVKTGRHEKDGISGIQMYYTGSCHTHALKNDLGKTVGEVRGRGAYVMAAGSVHPSGNLYTVINDVALALSPENSVQKPVVVGELIGTDRQNEIMQYVEAAFDASGIDYESAIEDSDGKYMWLIVCPWKSDHTSGKDFDTSSAVIMWPSGKLIYSCKHAHCEGHHWITQGPDKVGLRQWMEQTVGGKLVFSKKSEEDQVLFDGKSSSGVVRPDWADDILNDKEPPVQPVQSSQATPIDDDDKPENTHPYYDMTPEEIAAQEDADCPVFRLHPTPGPEFDESNLYGILGHITKKMCQLSEAHKATVYLNLIVSFGNLFGQGAYFIVNSTKHFMNEYLACIGASAKGRKGSTSDQAESVLIAVDPGWMNSRNMGGFSTVQGVITAIKDSDSFEKLETHGPMKGQYKTINRPGVSDKRLCIREGELSNVFKMMSEKNQKAGELVRNLWDSKPVSNLVAGKSADGEHNSLRCKEPHVSIIGSSTASLTKSTLPNLVATSGDGNRFIWCFTKRTQLVPRPPETFEWHQETIEISGHQVNLLERLMNVVAAGKIRQNIPLVKPAKKYWDCLYQRLENDERTGFLGGMTTRAAAHIRRMATILCLLDIETAVRVQHLQAAEAIWNYSQESARYIFVGYSLEQAKVIRKSETSGKDGITKKDVHVLFSNHKSGAWVDAQLAELVVGGFLTKTTEQRKEEDSIRVYEAVVYRFKKW